jgi:hypothetical protein
MLLLLNTGAGGGVVAAGSMPLQGAAQGAVRAAATSSGGTLALAGLATGLYGTISAATVLGALALVGGGAAGVRVRGLGGGTLPLAANALASIATGRLAAVSGSLPLEGAGTVRVRAGGRVQGPVPLSGGAKATAIGPLRSRWALPESSRNGGALDESLRDGTVAAYRRGGEII